MRVKVVTLNVEGIGKGWFDGRLEAVVEGLRPVEPDVICLQEVTTTRREDRVYDQSLAIAEALGLEHAIFDTYGSPEEADDMHQNGIAIVSRWPIRRARDRQLPAEPSGDLDRRVVLLADLMTPDGGHLKVVTTHLAWRPQDRETRLRQARMIFEVFVEEGFDERCARTIFAGDLNATPDEEVVALCRRDLQDVWEACHPDDPGHTWVKRNAMTRGWDTPDRRLDYIFTARGVEVRRAEILLDRPEPTWASDHFAVFAELEW